MSGSQFPISDSYNPSFASEVLSSSERLSCYPWVPSHSVSGALLHAAELPRSDRALLLAPGWTSSSSRAQRAGSSGAHSSGRKDAIRTTYKSRKYHSRREKWQQGNTSTQEVELLHPNEKRSKSTRDPATLFPLGQLSRSNRRKEVQMKTNNF